MSRKYAAVLFDMDGLLLDTEKIALEVLADTVEQAGYQWSPEVGQQMIGRNGHDGDQLLLKHYGRKFAVKKIRAEFLHQYEQHLQQHGVPTKWGAEMLLAELEQQQIPRAVVTSSRRRLTDLKLIKSGLREFFPVQICGDEIERGKPDPQGYLLAADQLRVAPERCLVLEDSAPGIEAALAAGMVVCWVPDQKPLPSYLQRAGIMQCSDLAQVKEQLFS